MCNHKTVYFCIRVFSNNSVHACKQCQECGSVIRVDGKPHIKISDIPLGSEVKPYNAELYFRGVN